MDSDLSQELKSSLGRNALRRRSVVATITMQTSSADPSLPAPPATSRAHPHTRHQARRRALFDAAREVDAAASVVLLCNAKDIFYLTGVREGISWLVVAGDHTIAV